MPHRRTLLTALLAGVGAVIAPSTPAQSQAACRVAKITGYVKSEFSAHTYDGTPIHTDEPICAASWNIPIDSRVWIEDLGIFRVADRGHLGYSDWIDVAVWSRSEAYALTGYRRICILPPPIFRPEEEAAHGTTDL